VVLVALSSSQRFPAGTGSYSNGCRFLQRSVVAKK